MIIFTWKFITKRTKVSNRPSVTDDQRSPWHGNKWVENKCVKFCANYRLIVGSTNCRTMRHLKKISIYELENLKFLAKNPNSDTNKSYFTKRTVKRYVINTVDSTYLLIQQVSVYYINFLNSNWFTSISGTSEEA